MNSGENETGGLRGPAAEGPVANGSICYLFGVLFPLLYLLSRPHDRNPVLRFHCFQSLLLFTIWAPLVLLNRSIANPLLGLTVVLGGVAWIVAIIKAKKGKTFRLPVIGALADWLSKL